MKVNQVLSVKVAKDVYSKKFDPQRAIYKAGDIIPAAELDRMSKISLPGLFNETTKAVRTRAKIFKQRGENFQPKSEMIKNAAMVENKGLALKTLG